MAQYQCDCCDGTVRSEPTGVDAEALLAGGGAGGVRAATIADGQDVLADEPLPDDLARALERGFDLETAPVTIPDLADAVRSAVQRTGDGAAGIEIDDLCHVDSSAHEARTGDETYRFACPLDAFVVPALVEPPTVVETVDPEREEPVVARVSADRVEVAPADAVLSLGTPAPADVERGAWLDSRAAIEALCPRIRAFADESAYRDWAADRDGPATSVPLWAAARLGRAFVGE